MTLCHTGTRDLAAHTRGADIVVVAAGRPGLLTADMVKPGAAVLDVGISRTEAGLVGDVDPAVAEVAGYLAPMPGGVGPMTRAMLLANVVEAAETARPRAAGGRARVTVSVTTTVGNIRSASRYPGAAAAVWQAYAKQSREVGSRS